MYELASSLELKVPAIILNDFIKKCCHQGTGYYSKSRNYVISITVIVRCFRGYIQDIENGDFSKVCPPGKWVLFRVVTISVLLGVVVDGYCLCLSNFRTSFFGLWCFLCRKRQGLVVSDRDLPETKLH